MMAESRKRKTWIYSRYDNDKIKSSICHPFYHKIRTAHILEKYKSKVDEQQDVECLHLDFGGAVLTTEPYVKLELSPGRSFSCWDHHVDLAIAVLEEADEVKHGRYTFFRFARWPGVICFISKTDRMKILRFLRSDPQPKRKTDNS